MSAERTLYQAVLEQIQAATSGSGMGSWSVARLAVLATGVIAARSCVLGQVAAAIWGLRLSGATEESIGRRLRRTLRDPMLEAKRCYAPAVQTMIRWSQVTRKDHEVVLALDDSSQDDRVHLFRVCLTYWGTAIPLAWAIWPQNAELAEGEYWRKVDGVLDAVAALLPAGLTVVVTADRAFDIAPFVDRIAARGWHWVVRLKANGANRFRDQRGREHGLRDLLRGRLAAPGRRWKARGQLFKKAGWRPASVVAAWARGMREPVVVLTDLPPRWDALKHYDRRFWIETGFRSDKRKGWQWEDSQVTDLARLDRLLVAMAWASLLVICLGHLRARTALDAPRAPTRRPAPRPQHARQSLFTLGLRLAQRWLFSHAGPSGSWHLTQLESPSWFHRWYQHQACLFIFSIPVRP
jgi:hypothetical protein